MRLRSPGYCLQVSGSQFPAQVIARLPCLSIHISEYLLVNGDLKPHYTHHHMLVLEQAAFFNKSALLLISVVEGSDFRFEEVRSVGYSVADNGGRDLIPQKPRTVNVNFQRYVIDVSATK